MRRLQQSLPLANDVRKSDYHAKTKKIPHAKPQRSLRKHKKEIKGKKSFFPFCVLCGSAWELIIYPKTCNDNHVTISNKKVYDWKCQDFNSSYLTIFFWDIQYKAINGTNAKLNIFLIRLYLTGANEKHYNYYRLSFWKICSSSDLQTPFLKTFYN